MVAEADESDRSFLTLSPTIAVVTNIDHEHMEAYGSFDRLVDAFVAFADRVPFYGAVVACADDPTVRQACGDAAATHDHVRVRRGRRRARPRRRSPTASRRVRRALRRARRRRRIGRRPPDAARAGRPQPAERAGGGRRRPRSRRAVRSASDAALANSAAPSAATNSRRDRRRHRRRRLRPSSDRNRGRAASGARRLPRAPRRRLPAAPLYAHA